jgi:hypothetical protein
MDLVSFRRDQVLAQSMDCCLCVSGTLAGVLERMNDRDHPNRAGPSGPARLIVQKVRRLDVGV